MTTANVLLLPRLSSGGVLQEKCISTQYTEVCLFCSITRLIEFPVVHQNGNFAVMVQSCKKNCVEYALSKMYNTEVLNHFHKSTTTVEHICFHRAVFFLINKLYVNSDFIRPFSFMYILFYQGCNAWSVLHCKSRYGIKAIMAFY